MTGKIRTMNGYNENPAPLQFVSAYRKLLYQSDILVSSYSNVMSQCSSNVLTVSSVTKQTNIVPPPSISEENEKNEENEETDWDEFLELQALDDCNHLMDYNDTGVSYVAHMLEKRLLTSNIYCNCCKKVLERNEKVGDGMCVNAQFGKPCISTYQLCKLTDSALKTLINTGPNFKQKVYLTVMNAIDFDKIFPEFFDLEHEIDHKHFLVQFFIGEYTNKKCAYVAKQKTISLQKRYMRNKLRKLGHNMRQ